MLDRRRWLSSELPASLGVSERTAGSVKCRNRNGLARVPISSDAPYYYRYASVSVG